MRNAIFLLILFFSTSYLSKTLAHSKRSLSVQKKITSVRRLSTGNVFQQWFICKSGLSLFAKGKMAGETKENSEIKIKIFVTEDKQRKFYVGDVYYKAGRLEEFFRVNGKSSRTIISPCDLLHQVLPDLSSKDLEEVEMFEDEQKKSDGKRVDSFPDSHVKALVANKDNSLYRFAAKSVDLKEFTTDSPLCGFTQHKDEELGKLDWFFKEIPKKVVIYIEGAASPQDLIACKVVEGGLVPYENVRHVIRFPDISRLYKRAMTYEKESKKYRSEQRFSFLLALPLGTIEDECFQKQFDHIFQHFPFAGFSKSGLNAREAAILSERISNRK